MEALKQYIVNVSAKTNNAAMCITKVSKDLNIEEHILDTMLRQLVDENFIVCSLAADNEIYEFYLQQ